MTNQLVTKESVVGGLLFLSFRTFVDSSTGLTASLIDNIYSQKSLEKAS